jgi:hypothetical protein
VVVDPGTGLSAPVPGVGQQGGCEWVCITPEQALERTYTQAGFSLPPMGERDLTAPLSAVTQDWTPYLVAIAAALFTGLLMRRRQR